MSYATTGAKTLELVPLAERLRYMQLFRFAFVAAAVLFAGFAPDFLSVPFGELAAGAGAFLLATIVAEALSRHGSQRALFGIMLILDAIYLAWLSYATGGLASPLRYLILLHLVAVVLLASYRTGLKLALWHSLLLFVVFHGQEAGILEPSRGLGQLPGSEYQQLVAFVAVLWLVTMATATFSAINERELRRRRVDLEALAAMATELEGATDSLAVADVLIENVGDAFGFERMALFSAGDDGFTLMAARGCSTTATRVAPGRRSVLARAAETREALLVSDLDPAEDAWVASLLAPNHNLIVLPLVAEKGCAALLVIEHSLRPDSRVERRVVSMLERFASHAALALLNAQLLEHVQRLAELDGLTMVANRRTFEASLERELSRARRTGGDVGLVMLDIDHFKPLNDTHGHQAGDQVLREVARVLQANSRDFDTTARYGGEEFALVLPGSSIADSVEAAERLRKVVAESGTLVPVTISVGVATFPHHAGDTSSLVQAADAALYESKHEGRNRVTVSGRGGGNLRAVAN